MEQRLFDLIAKNKHGGIKNDKRGDIGGKILRVDLTSGSITVEGLPKEAI